MTDIILISRELTNQLKLMPFNIYYSLMFLVKLAISSASMNVRWSTLFVTKLFAESIRSNFYIEYHEHIQKFILGAYAWKINES